MTPVRTVVLLAAVVVVAILGAPEPVSAQDTVVTSLVGVEEVPSISTAGVGFFLGTISADESSLDYTLLYLSLEGAVQQAHIHLGQEGVNGAVIVFLCTNVGGGPVPPPACPTPGQFVAGTLTAADVIARPAQGIAAGDLAGLIRAIRAGKAYVNVHSDLFPGGEIRGQIKE